MKKSYLFFAITALCVSFLAVSCQKGHDVADDPDTLSDDELVFTMSDVLSADVQTKVDEVSETTVGQNGFRAAATKLMSGSESSVWDNAVFSKSGSEYKGGKYWPIADPQYSFFGCNHDVSMTMTAAGATLANVSANKDIICAYKPRAQVGYKQTNALAFEHVFARVTSVKVNAEPGYSISDVTISFQPFTTGTYTIATGAGKTDGTGWSNKGGNGTVNLYKNVSNPGIGTQTMDIYLIPGTYALTATWTATRGDYVQTFNKTVNVNLVGGKRNTIETTLKGNATELVFTVSVNDWGTNTVNPTFPVTP